MLIDVIVVLLVAAPILPLSVLGVLLWRRAWRTASPSLRERTLLALRDAIVATIACLLALNRLDVINLPREAIVPMLGIAMLLVSLPSAWWLHLYSRQAFR